MSYSFNLPKNYLDLLSEMYDPSHLGAVEFQDAISPSFREGIVADLDQITHHKSPLGHLPGKPTFALTRTVPENLDVLQSFSDCCEKIITELIQKQGIDQESLYSQLFSFRYPSHSDGLAMHQDPPSMKLAVIVAVLKGKAPFYIGQHKENVLDAPEGSLLFLRAPRNEGEISLRTYHGTGPAEEPRHSLQYRPY